MCQMICLIAALVALFAASAPSEAFSPQRVAVLSGAAPNWVLASASADCDLQNARCYVVGSGQGIPSQYLSISRASTGMAQWADGHWSSFASNTLRITDQGLLIEEARKNLALQSQSFDNAAWLKNLITITPDDTTAPDGTVTADKTVETSTTGSFIENNAAFTVTSGGTYAVSVFVKQSNIQWFRITFADSSGLTNSARAWFDVQNGVVGTTATTGTGWTVSSLSITPASNGFYRCSAIFVTGATSAYVAFNSATANGGGTRMTNGAYWLWQSDIQLGSFITSPIPTTSSSATRAADIITLSGPLLTAGLNAHAARFETNGVVGGNLPRFIDFGAVQSAYWNTSTLARLDNGSGTSAIAGTGSGSYGTLQKVSFGFDSSSLTAIANAGTKTTSSGNFGALSSPYLGNRSAGDRALNGYMRRFTLSASKGAFDATTQ